MGAAEAVSVPRINEFVPVVHQEEVVGVKTNLMLYPTQLKVVSSQQRQQRRQEQRTTSSSQINAKKVTSEKPRVLWRTMALTTITTIEELTRTQTVDWNISPYSSPCSPLPFDGEQSKVEHLLGLFKTATRR